MYVCASVCALYSPVIERKQHPLYLHFGSITQEHDLPALLALCSSVHYSVTVSGTLTCNSFCVHGTGKNRIQASDNQLEMVSCVLGTWPGLVLWPVC